MNISYIVGIVLLVLMSAYFSATETAFSSINKAKLKVLVEKEDRKSKKAKLVLKLVEKYDKLLSTILIGNNIVNIAVASLGTVMFIELYGDMGATISTVVITLIVLMFGEICPKSIAKDCPESFAMFSAPYINILLVFFTPLNFLFTLFKKIINKIFGVKNESTFSSEELMMMVDEVQQDGDLEEDESELIKNAIEFSERAAEDIITHRTEIEAVNETATKEEISEIFKKTQFSRILVFKETIDDIIGVIHMKDFYTDIGITKKSVKEIMTKPVYIQKNEKINDILKKLQIGKSHIAIVVDEYGGTHGIITMEDILEELVGEIYDEHDEIEETIKKISENVFEVDGSLDFDVFCKSFEINCECENNSTGGWVMEYLSKIPEINETFTYKNLDIKVTGIDSHRVSKIKVEVKPEEQEKVENE